MASEQELEKTLKEYILAEFLLDEDPEDLTNDVELVTTGILDSISILKVVAHVEELYNIVIEPHEASVENLNTIAAMTALLAAKTA